MINSVLCAVEKTKIILVVDDSELWRFQISRVLNAVSCVKKVIEAGSYDEAIPFLHERPDFILLDIHMPGKNGIELLRFIKANFPEPSICMVSNSVNMMTRDEWKRLGVDDYFDKSGDFDRIVEFIECNVIKNENA